MLRLKLIWNMMLGRPEGEQVLEVSGALVIVGDTNCGTVPLLELKSKGQCLGLGLHGSEPYPLLAMGWGVKVQSGSPAKVKGLVARSNGSLNLVLTIGSILRLNRVRASWTGQTERWFASLSERQVNRGSHYIVQQIKEAIRESSAIQRQQPESPHWIKSAGPILASLLCLGVPFGALIHLRLMRGINDSGASSLLLLQRGAKSPDFGSFPGSSTNRKFSTNVLPGLWPSTGELRINRDQLIGN